MDSGDFFPRMDSDFGSKSALPSLKRRFPFRLATTSYIMPAPILPNLLFLGRHLDEVEIVLFESGNETNLPTQEEIREMSAIGLDMDLTFNVHLPGDLFFGEPDASLRQRFEETALRFYERTLPLDPTCCILHLDSRRADGTRETDRNAWMDRVKDSLYRMTRSGLDLRQVVIENLEYPLEKVAGLVEAFNMCFCLDIGHLIRYGHDLESNLGIFLERSPMVHLHGVNDGRDHCSVEWIPQDEWQVIVNSLRSYPGGVCLEVFSLEDLRSSLSRMVEFY